MNRLLVNQQQKIPLLGGYVLKMTFGIGGEGVSWKQYNHVGINELLKSLNVFLTIKFFFPAFFFFFWWLEKE